MKIKRVTKMLTIIVMLITLFLSPTIRSLAKPGAGIDFYDPDPTLYTVTFYSNDDRVDTTLAQIQIVGGSMIGSVGMPQNPTRPGFSFIGWNTLPTGTGSSVTASTIVNSNLSVFAQWMAIVIPTPTPIIPESPPLEPPPPELPPEPPPVLPPPPEPPPEPPPIIPPDPPPPVPPAPPPLDVPPEPPGLPTDPLLPGPLMPELPAPIETLPDLEEIDLIEQAVPQIPIDIDDLDTPLVNLNGRPILIFAPLGLKTWALFNLIMSIAGILLVVVTVIRILRRKREENKKEVERSKQRTDQRPNNVEANDPEKKYKLRWFIAETIAAIIAIFVFIMTQDITAIIALTDWWTVIHIILLSVISISCVTICKEKRTKDDFYSVYRENEKEQM